ncbi:hypothetical protein A3B42_02345 [Candidatus Daviesbacteria bacterium RIFCSPLOWO2_01_FULL_38_10]|uniref:Glycosyl transferase family 2 n=1 Tax=Candidatus Daviesbacteria bacterium GW2011_GWF2_38_6 TaxID=1618432 RepID=A0A0G0KK69_9BACT|nr:MAG: Glycosyl transferase family 2 [Candidatus Daviesbacteria bacterium GW2011_GWA2_38_17]KKQ79157.1 MAG: Glycosyl transferase family 2 [Candidatus Daviesbacteria bacterium GW2011_GWF2_38_6]OGE27223.1 MAG: hypothetical protein A2772_02615 [Candidatus Daviesbacteria bacterium RIFCSPHIGHO2_01_FULL_38_8b]OGE37426.1 MAG: hypothetical protein A3B42_02345 [Candidatus Daviesbacteria bacterium RIFCSPLOWO2_01_FULL_38_10]OGE44596.1 MAG: hypothetical protein A3E67_02640 [Candidatus Daviesbacteria bacte
MISTVVVCFNEAEKLQKCLKSATGFADELVVVDLDSSDASIEVANKFGAKVFHHQFVPFVELVRDYAIAKTSGDWVLVLDSDEEIGKNLKEKLKEVVKKQKFTAVNIPRKNIFFGKWIKHTNWWPDRHIRFFKKGTVLWSAKIHSYPAVAGEILDLEAREDLAIVHFGYDSIEEFLDRQNRYSSIEAANLYDSGLRFSWVLFFWKPAREFLVRFLRHRGFLDGFYGLALTILMMIYQMIVLVKIWELEQE